ncbi:ACP S-malonyltransferase [Natronospora cellulosivora (SeqCode)]
MSKIAFVFPGQGSQYVGMGKEFIEQFSFAEDIIENANKILDFNLKELCLNGPVEDLNNTRNTQVAIYTISYIINKVLESKDIYPDIVAGHSLGHYSALAASEVLSFEDGLNLVQNRGIIMSDGIEDLEGSMAAIIGLEEEKILFICQKVEGVCELANYNSPGQVVISGEIRAIKEACALAEEGGAKKVVELKVSGPFHSSLMEKAESRFAEYLKDISFNQPRYPIVDNVTANFLNNPLEIKELLIKQISGSVRWLESVQLMIANNVETFIEVGPGRVLKGLMRRIDRSVNAYNVEDIKSLDKLITKL